MDKLKFVPHPLRKSKAPGAPTEKILATPLFQREREERESVCVCAKELENVTARMCYCLYV